MHKPERFDFNYNDILPRKPGVSPVEDVEIPKVCRRCGAAFVTRSRAKKRCDPCAVLVAARGQERANERLRERRKAARKA